MFSLFDSYWIGTRVYAQGKWWQKIKYYRDGIFSVIDKDAILPAPILIVKQSEKDAKYQEVLFRKF